MKAIPNLAATILLYVSVAALAVLAWAEFREARALERIIDKCVVPAVPPAPDRIRGNSGGT